MDVPITLLHNYYIWHHFRYTFWGLCSNLIYVWCSLSSLIEIYKHNQTTVYYTYTLNILLWLGEIQPVLSGSHFANMTVFIWVG